MTKTKINTNKSVKTFKGLMNGIIAITIVSFAMVAVLLILTFTVLGINAGWLALEGVALVFYLLQIACDIGWIICIAIALAKVGEVKQYIDPTNFRITFGISLGLYVLFWILGMVLFILGFFQMILLIVTLVFAIMNKNKLTKKKGV